jgi:hypothetical protein
MFGIGNETTQLQYTGKGGHQSLDDILKMTEEYEEEERRQKEEMEEAKANGDIMDEDEIDVDTKPEFGEVEGMGG